MRKHSANIPFIRALNILNIVRSEYLSPSPYPSPLRGEATRYEQPDTSLWRTRSQPIRTFGEITASIKILPVHQPYLYQKLSRKATQLRLLGMSYGKIAESLHINKKTVTKACEMKRGKLMFRPPGVYRSK